MKHTTLSYDSASGVETVFSQNDDLMVSRDIQTGPVVSAIMDENTRIRNGHHSGHMRKLPANDHIIGQIPITMFTNWKREWEEKYSGDFTFDTFLASRLNDPDYKYFKTVDRRL